MYRLHCFCKNRKPFWLTAALILGLFGFPFHKEVTATQAPRPAPSTAPDASLVSESTASARKDQFLDDRSNPVQILKSYYNAINRKEYVRAYYYWGSKGNSAASQPPTYSQFEAGYANTTFVQVTTGKVESSGAAGTFYFQVPVTLVATHANGSPHTYVGCYTIRQPNPKNFGAPPFIPMSINFARIREVPSSSNTVVLMNTSCR